MAVLRRNVRKQVRRGKAGTRVKVKTTPPVASAARAALVAGAPVKKIQRQVARAIDTTVTFNRPPPGNRLRRSNKVEAASARVRKRLRSRRSVR